MVTASGWHVMLVRATVFASTIHIIIIGLFYLRELILLTKHKMDIKTNLC